MAQDQIEEIKNKIDIVEFINSYLSLKKAGRNFKALCPFHAEKTPSFMVSPERQIWHCFGCGTGGDIFGFLMQYENLEFPEALRILADKAGVKLKRDYSRAGRSKKDLFYALNHLAAEFFHHLLLNDPVGKNSLDYLKNRKVNLESIQNFKLGYAPKSWDSLGRFLIKKGYQVQDAEAAGLLVKKGSGRGYYDRFRGRIMFPIFSPVNQVLGFSGRRTEKKESIPKYLNSPETLIFNKSRALYGFNLARDEIKKEDEVILVEGNLDVVSSHQVGVKNVVAPMGSALTFDQVKILKRYTDKAQIAFDIDFAGKEAARRGIEIAEQAGMSIKIIQIKGASDPDELVRKDPQEWRKAIQSSIPVYDFLLGLIFKKYNSETPYGKKKIGEETISILTSISDKITQAHYIKKLAEEINLSSEAVTEAVGMAARKDFKAKSFKEIIQSKSETKERKELLEEYFLSLLLKLGGLSSVIQDIPDDFELEKSSFQEIWQVLKGYSEKKFDIQKFCAKLKPELTKEVDQLYLKEWGEEEDEILEKEIRNAFRELQKINLREGLKRLSQQIKKAEMEGDEDLLKKLSKEFNLASRRLAEF